MTTPPPIPVRGLFALALVGLAFSLLLPGALAQVASGSREVMAGDRLRISVTEQPELNGDYTVAGDGTIDFPLIGRILVETESTAMLGDKLESALKSRYFKVATVQVDISDFVEGSIHITGEVRRPGSIEFGKGSILTLFEAITQSGGLTENAAGSQVRILRWKPGGSMERQVIAVDVQSMIDTLDFGRDQYLRPRDIVLVPRLGDTDEARAHEFLVLGQVAKSGFHKYTENLDVIRAVTAAGGFTTHADIKSARLLRLQPDGNYLPSTIDLSRLFGGGDMTMNMPVGPGDIIFIPSAEQASRGQAYFLGEVRNKGPYNLPNEGKVTLAQAVLAQGGLSEFANGKKVKLIRVAPNGSRQTLTFNVDEILSTGDFSKDIPLESGDVIVIPGRVLF